MQNSIIDYMVHAYYSSSYNPTDSLHGFLFLYTPLCVGAVYWFEGEVLLWAEWVPSGN